MEKARSRRNGRASTTAPVEASPYSGARVEAALSRPQAWTRNDLDVLPEYAPA